MADEKEAPEETTDETTDPELSPSDEAIDAKCKEVMLADPDDPEMDTLYRSKEDPDADDDSEESTDDSDTENDEDADKATDDDSEDETTKDDEPESKDGLDEKTRNAAKMLGVSEEDAATLAKSGKWGERVLDNMRTAVTNTGRAWSKLGRTEAENEQLKAQIAASEEEAKPSEEPADEKAPRFAAEHWGEDEAKVLNDQDAEIVSLKEDVTRLSEYFKEDRERQVAREFDAFFGELDTEQYPGFGEGSMDKLPDGSERQSRQEVVDRAFELVAGARHAGRDLDTHTAMQEALGLVKPDAKAKAVRRDIKKKVVKRKKQMTARPTPRRSIKPGPEGDEQAMTALRSLAEKDPEIAEHLAGGL